MRWLLVIALLFPFIYKDIFSQKKLILENSKYLILLGFLSVSIYTPLLYWGLHYTTVLNAAILNATIPMIIVFFSFILLSEQIKLFKIIGAISSLLGAIIILTMGNIKVISNFSLNKGNLLLLLACTAWAIYSVLIKKMNHSLPPLVFLFCIATSGLIFIFPGFLIEYLQHLRVHLSYHVLLSIIYAAVFSSILAFSFWNYGVKSIGPQKAGTFFNLLPIFGALLGIIFLKEKIYIYHLLGIAFVFGGIYLSQIDTIKNISKLKFTLGERKS